MKRFLKFLIVSTAFLIAISSVSAAPSTKRDKERFTPCALETIDTSSKAAFTRSYKNTLWTMRSSVWNGYIDFTFTGNALTHWGSSHVTVTGPGKLQIKNDYDGYSLVLTFSANGRSYSGIRNDGVEVSGRLICAKYVEDLKVGTSDAETFVNKTYLQIQRREPDPEGFRYWVKQVQNTTEEQRAEIIQFMCRSPEYKALVAKTGIESKPCLTGKLE